MTLASRRMTKTVVVAGALDTKGREFAFVKELIEAPNLTDADAEVVPGSVPAERNFCMAAPRCRARGIPVIRRAMQQPDLPSRPAERGSTMRRP